MKIGLCLSSAPGYSETFIRSKIKGLIQAGFEVQVFLFNKALSKDDIQYCNPFPLKYPWVFFCIPIVLLYLILRQPIIVKKFFKLERADKKKTHQILKSLYINAHILLQGKLDWLHFGFATIAIGRENIAAAIDSKLAVSLRGFDIGLYPLTHPGCYEKLWTSVHKVHTISDDLLQLAIENGLSKDTPIQKIRPAIRIQLIVPKSNLGELQNPVRILSIGRLEWKKGFIYSLQAMHVLKQRGVKFNYSIIGSGSVDLELLHTVRDLKLEDSVSLLGKVSHEEIFNKLNQSDIYIQPSVQEGFCNALLEAQGTGLLCISTNAEGLSENIMHGHTGWIVPKRDYTAIADKVEEIMAMGCEKRAQIAQTAISRVVKEFNLDRLILEFKSFYAN